MHAYLFAGNEKSRAVQRLAIGLASMRQPTLLVRFGSTDETDALDDYAQVLPIQITNLRLPGMGLPQSHTPADEVVTQTVVAVLRTIVASGDYRLVILDRIRELVARNLLDTAELYRLVSGVSDCTQLAITWLLATAAAHRVARGDRRAGAWPDLN